MFLHVFRPQKKDVALADQVFDRLSLVILTDPVARPAEKPREPFKTLPADENPVGHFSRHFRKNQIVFIEFHLPLPNVWSAIDRRLFSILSASGTPFTCMRTRVFTQ